MQNNEAEETRLGTKLVAEGREIKRLHCRLIDLVIDCLDELSWLD